MPSAFTEKLPCDLSPAERLRKAEEMSRQIKAHAEIQLKKKEETSRYGRAIKESDQRIAELAKEVRDGVEYRQIGCTENRNFRENVVDIIRMDTGQIVRSRPLTTSEKQAELFEQGYTPRPKEVAAVDEGVGERGELDDEDDTASSH